MRLKSDVASSSVFDVNASQPTNDYMAYLEEEQLATVVEDESKKVSKE